MHTRLPIDTFEKRSQSPVDVFSYENPSPRLRQQIMFAIRDVLGPCQPRGYGSARASKGYQFWQEAHELCLRELGRPSLSASVNPRFYDAEFESFLKTESNTVRWLTVVEITTRVIDVDVRRTWTPHDRVRLDPDEFVETLNTRLRENGFGYVYEGGIIMKVSSDYLHSAAVRPAIQLLGTAGFEGARDEFLRAHQRYREGAFEAALQEALKSNESVMKSILTLHAWDHGPKDPFKKLLTALHQHGFFGAEMLDYYMGGLDKILTGLPTVRNQPGAAHGSGPEPRRVPEHLCALALHHAAANIVFLIRQYQATQR